MAGKASAIIGNAKTMSMQRPRRMDSVWRVRDKTEFSTEVMKMPKSEILRIQLMSSSLSGLKCIMEDMFGSPVKRM